MQRTTIFLLVSLNAAFVTPVLARNAPSDMPGLSPEFCAEPYACITQDALSEREVRTSLRYLQRQGVEQAGRPRF